MPTGTLNLAGTSIAGLNPDTSLVVQGVLHIPNSFTIGNIDVQLFVGGNILFQIFQIFEKFFFFSLKLGSYVDRRGPNPWRLCYGPN